MCKIKREKFQVNWMETVSCKKNSNFLWYLEISDMTHLESLGGKNMAPDDITHDDTNFQSCTSSGETYNDHKFLSNYLKGQSS